MSKICGVTLKVKMINTYLVELLKCLDLLYFSGSHYHKLIF